MATDPTPKTRVKNQGRPRHDRELTELHQLIRLDTGPLRTLLAKVDRIETLNRALQAWGPEPWLKSIRVANASDDTLVLFADNAAVLTNLRFKREAMLRYLFERHGCAFERIEAKVRPRSARGGV